MVRSVERRSTICERTDRNKSAPNAPRTRVLTLSALDDEIQGEKNETDPDRQIQGVECLGDCGSLQPAVQSQLIELERGDAFGFGRIVFEDRPKLASRQGGASMVA